ncbi:MAG: cysteine desulfurase [Candidatus Woesearchaeota archaeon]
MIGLNVDKIRKDFPVLNKKIIYFDSACMALKPQQVVDAMNRYYSEYPACAGRSAHSLAKTVEHEVDKSRAELGKFINAKRHEEIIFTRNTTEGINLIANSLGLKSGDEVVISDKEHNSNLIPWLKLKKTVGIKLKVVDSNPDNTFNLENLDKTLTDKTKLVSVVHTSNLDGVTNPIADIASAAHKRGALMLVDGAQSIPGRQVDVRKLDVDFLSFSGHKMCGPTGTGVLYGKMELLEKLDQFLVGGETVIESTYDSYDIENIPMRFEAGLQDYAGIIGLGEACRYIQKIGFKNIMAQEELINTIMTEGIEDNAKVNIIGPKDPTLRSGVFSFNIKGMDPHHVAGMLDASKKIMVRSGAHCVHSWFNKHKLHGSARASAYFYNTEEEAETFVKEISKISKF